MEEAWMSIQAHDPRDIPGQSGRDLKQPQLLVAPHGQYIRGSPAEDWRFKADDTRIGLKHLYPPIQA
jgi:hypothetical protein